ncbi:MAG: DUF177 domain-containing protein [Betaproteobacteria bacterium]|nr:DUF177 domain-containing protein [Betaproteobacteria bacterium]
MSAQAVIDSLEFARTGQTLRGNLPVSGLARLQDGLYDALGEVEFVVQGGTDARRRPVLMLDVRGVLHLRCQRCLGALDYPLRLANTLLLVSEAEAVSGAPDDEDIEWLEASAELDVAGLVEDEVLLGLPYAPRHDEGGCARDAGMRQERSKPSPFAKLAALKRDQ